MKPYILNLLPVACLAIVLSPTFGADTPIVRDIALRSGGILVGQVVDTQGVAQANVPVSIQFGQQEVARTTTDANGVFAAQGLRGGQYSLITRDGASVCRVWMPGTEPPAAQPAALVVSGNHVVRGMPGDRPWTEAHTYVSVGVLAAAIATPILVISSDDDDSAS